MYLKQQLYFYCQRGNRATKQGWLGGRINAGQCKQKLLNSAEPSMFLQLVVRNWAIQYTVVCYLFQRT